MIACEWLKHPHVYRVYTTVFNDDGSLTFILNYFSFCCCGLELKDHRPLVAQKLKVYAWELYIMASNTLRYTYLNAEL